MQGLPKTKRQSKAPVTQNTVTAPSQSLGCKPLRKVPFTPTGRTYSPRTTGSRFGTTLSKETHMPKLNSLDDLLVHELQDIYNAESQILKALPKMIKAASHPELQSAFEEHLEQTEGQVERLDQVFKLLGVPAKGKKCEGMAGVIEEGKKVMEEDAEPAVMDAALIAAAQKVEHYEIASYGCVCTYAEMLGYDQVHDLLGQTLEEEETTDEKLSMLAESVINIEAEESEDAEEEASR
jgi:ferritin-like metal-binding protein YciE